MMPERDEPDHEQRSELARSRPRDSEEAGADRGQALARAHQVAGEEDREEDLRDLAGLEREEPERDPHVGVGVGAEARDDRQQQQQDAREPRDVGVAEEHAVVAQQHDDRDRADERDARPGELAGGCRIPAVALQRDVDAVDHREPEAGEKRRDRHDERVGIPRPQAQHDVQRDDERGEAAAVDEERPVDRAEGAELHESDGGPR